MYFGTKRLNVVKFDNDENLTILGKGLIELAQAIGFKRKSHRFQGGCIKWWASVCYLPTRLFCCF